MPMRRDIKELFSFSRKELNGILVLLGLLLLVLLANLAVSYWVPEPREDFSAFEEELAMIRANRQTLPDTAAEVREGRHEEATGELFYFDPNTAGREDLLRLGMSERVALNLVKYREKGGKIRRKKDLLKIYGLAHADYQRLEPFIRLPDDMDDPVGGKAEKTRQSPAGEYRDTDETVRPPRPETGQGPVPAGADPAKIPVMELNTADSAMLIRLPGIGEVLSARIVRYRKRLGGFYDRRQLLEVYGLDTSWFHRFEKYLTIDTLVIRKIPVNRAGAWELLRLPYWSRKQVNVLLNYRELHGPFASAAALKDIRVLETKVIRQVAPYLSFE